VVQAPPWTARTAALESAASLSAVATSDGGFAQTVLTAAAAMALLLRGEVGGAQSNRLQGAAVARELLARLGDIGVILSPMTRPAPWAIWPQPAEEL
jgi:hypothetical protein